MAKIRRALDWMGRAFDFVGPRRAPSEVEDRFRPTFDAFGSSRLGELQVESIFITQGLIPGGALELAHSQVPAGFWRFYFSMEVWHNNATAQILALARVVPSAGPPAFPIARFTSEFVPGQNIRVAFTFQQFGPGSFLALEARDIPTGTTMSMTMVWMEIPLGESFHIL